MLNRRDIDYAKVKAMTANVKSQKERLLENILFYKNIMKYEKKIAEKVWNKSKIQRTRRITSIPGRKLFPGAESTE
jgi:hypothetical protein